MMSWGFYIWIILIVWAPMIVPSFLTDLKKMSVERSALISFLLTIMLIAVAPPCRMCFLEGRNYFKGFVPFWKINYLYTVEIKLISIFIIWATFCAIGFCRGHK